MSFEDNLRLRAYYKDHFNGFYDIANKEDDVKQIRYQLNNMKNILIELKNEMNVNEYFRNKINEFTLEIKLEWIDDILNNELLNDAKTLHYYIQTYVENFNTVFN